MQVALDGTLVDNGTNAVPLWHKMSATEIDIIKTIERLLRAQPRNRDVILVCGELHARITAGRVPTRKMEPWEVEGISRRTWYRRQAAAEKAGEKGNA